MTTFFNEISNTVQGTFLWVIQSITFEVPWYKNYFWGLIAISLIVWGLEILFPWRKNQALFRKDFWLDTGYMFFNFFVFTIVISGFYKAIEFLLLQFNFTNESLAIISISSWPTWSQLLVFFVTLDFVQWYTHRLLHKYYFLWKFHKVHHSVKEMGFAAHLRYHWMENVLYKPFKIIAVMLLGGFEPEQAYFVHFFAILIGHLNHANLKITWGPLKYILNNPVMHLYHHAYSLPKGSYGMNFGISLSLWDYLFKTNYIPEDSGTIPIGFKGDEKFPTSFLKQSFYGFTSKKNTSN